MSFTDQKPWVATAKDVKARWGSGFHCKLCGHKFKENDIVRFVFGNHSGHTCGNLLVCQYCDGEDVLVRADKSYNEAVKLAKQWSIYGPDWQNEWQNAKER